MIKKNIPRLEPILSVKNLTKIYPLYKQRIDRLKEALHPVHRKYHQDFYALKNISFDIQRGEIVGIIGKNGAGKSTLLKILSGVLTPTAGTVLVQGKIASLLELSVGFNPELTGIENIYFKGALLGFTKKQMDSKLEKILAFAEIGDFAYQPVKIYSSGMSVRLAFAVAIHVNSEIILLDEVLSVGDIGFREKCYSAITSMVRKKRKSIILVTHDIVDVRHFCNKIMCLHAGAVVYLGKDIEKGIRVYGENCKN